MRTDLLVFSKTLWVERTHKFRAARAVISFFALIEVVDKLVSSLHLADVVVEAVKAVFEMIMKLTHTRQGKPPSN
jgi:hypothetical protein